MATYNPDGTLAVGKTIGRFAIDVFKISLAVAGGIGAYKLVENYLSGETATAIPCNGAVPALPETTGTAFEQAAYVGYRETF